MWSLHNVSMIEEMYRNGSWGRVSVVAWAIPGQVELCGWDGAWQIDREPSLDLEHLRSGRRRRLDTRESTQYRPATSHPITRDRSDTIQLSA